MEFTEEEMSDSSDNSDAHSENDFSKPTGKVSVSKSKVNSFVLFFKEFLFNEGFTNKKKKIRLERYLEILNFPLSFQVIMSPSSTSSSTDSEVAVPRRHFLEDKEAGPFKHSTDGDSVFGTEDANVTLETPEDEEPIRYFVFCVFHSFHSFLIYLFFI